MALAGTLLVGSAVGILMASGVQAAEIAAVQPLPASGAYAPVCAAYGKGFHHVSGTETCLRIWGFMQWLAEYQSAEASPDFDGEPEELAFDDTQSDQFDMYARFRVRLDAREETDWGVLRGFAEVDWSGDNGATSRLRYAYVQLENLTVGFAPSEFNFGVSGPLLGSIVGGRSTRVPLIAYRMPLGDGFSIAAALEENADTAVLGQFVSSANLGRDEAPDVVAALRVAQSWGTAQVAAATRQVNSFAEYDDCELQSGSRGDGLCTRSVRDFGYAVMAAAAINIDPLGNGGTLSIKGAYGEGAANYVGIGPDGYLSVFDQGAENLAGDFEPDIQLFGAFSTTAGLEVGLTPAIVLAAYGGYAEATEAEDRLAIAGFRNGKHILRRLSEGRTMRKFNLGTTISWTPLDNVNFGVDVFYAYREIAGAFEPERNLPGKSKRTDGFIVLGGITRSF